MGVFGIGTNVRKIDSGIIRGNTYHITCMAWYGSRPPSATATFKFGDEDGILQTITDLKIIQTDFKCYDSDQVNKYRCYAVFGGVQFGFKLIIYILSCQWVMVV